MAKIKEIKFELEGLPYSVNITCNKHGIFFLKIPSIISGKLNLNSDLSNSNLGELEKEFNKLLLFYKNVKTTEELCIAISYGASGFYTKKNNGSVLFPNSIFHQYTIGNSIDSLGFDFRIVIRENIDGLEHWYYAKKGNNYASFEKQYLTPEKWFKNGKFNDLNKQWKKIPYSDKALSVLIEARETIRKASEILFNFIEQDEKAIEQFLNNQNLLQ